MSKSVKVKNVRINSSTVQAVRFRAFANGNFICSTRGLPKLKVVFDANDKNFFVYNTTKTAKDFKSTFISARNPAKAFAKAVKALWS